MANRKKKAEQPIILTTAFWDCECEKDYIHPKFIIECEKCKTHQDDQPDSHVNEVQKIRLANDYRPYPLVPLFLTDYGGKMGHGVLDVDNIFRWKDGEMCACKEWSYSLNPDLKKKDLLTLEFSPADVLPNAQVTLLMENEFGGWEIGWYISEETSRMDSPEGYAVHDPDGAGADWSYIECKRWAYLPKEAK